jgi:multiple antibiotic resistance protein
LSEKKKVFSTAVLTGFFLLLVFLFAGTAILDLFNLTIDDLRIAGGILLLFFSIEILLRGKINVEHKEEIGAVPLGCPLLVGPGAITTAMVLLKIYGYAAVLSAIFVCFIIIWLILRYADFLHKVLGKNGSIILSKISAILISAIAVQFIKQGILAIFS